MARNSVNNVVPHLRETVLRQNGAEPTDGELLEQYVARRDEASFEALVHRHGPMVLGVCRRVLHNEADSEDAFQATFLVFVRKAASIRSRNTVSNWLYGVAHNTALKAKAMNRKRRAKEREAGNVPKTEPAETVRREAEALLDAELSRLPDKYRAALVLCELEGKTIKEAALRLRLPQGTLASRLARGRALLGKRMKEHGLILSGGVLTAALSQGMATASVPPQLVLTTVRAAKLFAGERAVGVVSASVAALTDGVLKAMLMKKLKTAAALVLAVVLLGVGGAAYRMLTAEASEGTKEVVAAAPAPVPPRNDGKGDEKINLPKSRALEQVLVTLEKDGKLVVTVPIARSYTYDYNDLRILDTKGNKVEKKALAALIQGETVAMAADHGLAVDPLHLRVLKEGTLVFILPPPVPGAELAPGGTFPGAPAAAPAPEYEKLNLPKSRPLEQVLVAPEKDGKLVVKVAVTGFFPTETIIPGGESHGVELRTVVRSDTYDLDEVRVLDTNGKKLDSKAVAKLLKGETVAVAAFHNQTVDPLHLRVLKEGTLVFILPDSKVKVP
jgi:RNA polymerase sigma factor (sigma-70 family)